MVSERERVRRVRGLDSRDSETDDQLSVHRRDAVPAGATAAVANPRPRGRVEHLRFVHAGFMELLKYRGMYTTHATALEKNGHGILMSGQSGRGKTTSFLSLLRSGYRCVSDDHPLLRSNNHEIEALGFPVKVDVTNNTVKLFPELQEAGPLLHQGRYKKYFYVEDLYSWGVAEVCRPRILLFPHVIDSPTSRLELLSKAQALENLLPQGLLVYDRNIAKQEFQTLTRLVEQVDSYQLHFGHDVLNLPQLINPLLEVA